MKCFKCDQTIESTTSDGRCPICKWDGGEGLSEESEAYVVFVSLVYRTISEGLRLDDFHYQIEASERELAILKEGDQATVDNSKWTILEIDAGELQFQLRAFKVIRLPNQSFHEFSHDDPTDQIKKELLRWRDIRLAIDEMWRLKSLGKLESHLEKPEKQRNHHRSWVQDESPYYGNQG